MGDALIISAIGMSLVFIGLVALWWMMAGIVSLANIKKAEKVNSSATKPVSNSGIDDQSKHIAAAAAVATAIHLKTSPTNKINEINKTTISPWQIVHRSHQYLSNKKILRGKE